MNRSLKAQVEAQYIIVEAEPLIALDFIKGVAKQLQAIWQKGNREKSDTKKLNENLNSYVKKKTSGDLKTFADAAIDYFKSGKLKWDEFGWFQGEYKPGFEVIPWSYLNRSLDNLSPSVEREMPRAFQQKLGKTKT